MLAIQPKGQVMAQHRLRILHLSDLHCVAKDDWRRRRVLGDAWLKNLDDLLADGAPVDLVCFTGDLAYHGQEDEYACAADFLLATLERLKVDPSRFFAVQGNHDVYQKRNERVWRSLRNKLRPDDAEALSRWMIGEGPPRGITGPHREKILARQAAYRDCLSTRLGRPELLPDASRHPNLGYRAEVALPGLPFPVYVIGLDSAWLCGDNNDSGRLWLTEDQVMRLASDDGVKLPGFKLGLMHHPLTDMVDGADCRRLLADHVDLLLRGHWHEEEASLWADPDHQLRGLAAGCLYDGSRWHNAFHVIDLTLDESGRPLHYNLWFRGWTAKGFWHDDDSLYRDSRAGRLRIDVAPRVPEAPAGTSRAGELFIGRQPELNQLEDALLKTPGPTPPVAIVSVQGMPGVGKSYLAARFVYCHAGEFPGGIVRLALPVDDPRDGQALCRDLADELKLPSAGAEQVAVLLDERLQMPLSLLLIENVDAKPQALAVVELLRMLPHARAILTGRYQQLGQSAGWPQVPVRPFDPEDAMRQLVAEHRAPGPNETQDFHRLLNTLGFLPLAIHLAAGHLRAGSTVTGFLQKLRDSGLEVGPADPADPITADRARSILSTTFELSIRALSAALGAEAEPIMAGLAALGHAPPSGLGRSLGAAVAGLEDGRFERLTVEACRLSLLEHEGPPGCSRDLFRVHPLLAELLQRGLPRNVVVDRMTEWFVARLPPRPPEEHDQQGRAWGEIVAENDALLQWLRRAPPDALRQIERAGTEFASACGPFRAWADLCERGLDRTDDPAHRSNFLWTLAQVAYHAGDLERARNAATEKLQLDRDRGQQHGAALAAGRIADILQSRGELDEALRIRQEEELPVYERLGDVRSCAATMGNIARILQDRGELDEALRTLREEVLPAFERLGDVRLRAATMGLIAEILQDRGELDEALRTLREEVLPSFERLGDVRSRAVTMGQIAYILESRGELDEALRIRQEELLPVFERLGDVRQRAATMDRIAYILESRGKLDEALRFRQEEVLPVFERLGEVRSLLVGRTNLAILLKRRGDPGDREEAKRLLTLALESARELRLPETQQIEQILDSLDRPS